ncbi:alpha-2-macroglobulin [Bombina bombina]|uniref:alpha-2-macroglobulin n=1 Tax=Bombina bombina TaxID=8345 RepID=UPI00235A7220|nr:alpha-2-macroglobulin [Bombina bombina]
MLPQALYVGVILLQLLGTLQAELHYAVIFPSQIRFPGPELACLHLEGAKEAGTIQVTLQNKNRNTTLIERSFQQEPLFNCESFQVPPPSSSQDEVAFIDVTIRTSGEHINKQSKVLLMTERHKTLIQTDKAVYKPGQTVKFRVISLKESLQPNNIPFPVIELQDPGKNRIGQWLNVTPQQGIADHSFPLSSEPTLGEYSIRLANTVHSFTVEEYVLPKFEVTLQFPKVLMFFSEYVHIQICGRYTYGKPVQGTFICNICRKAYRYYYYRRADAQDLCVSLSGELDKSGCYTSEVESSKFNLLSNQLSYELVGEASVTEEGTGVQLSTSSKVSISSLVHKVTFVDADNFYRRGIPYTGKVKVVDASDTPLPDTPVYLTATYRYGVQDKLNLLLVTDVNGEVSFKIENTSNWEDRITLKAATKTQRQDYQHGLFSQSYMEGHLALTPFYSKSNSYLKVHSLQGALPCEGQQNVRVEFAIQSKDLAITSGDVNLHYLVVSKGRLRDYGSLKIPTVSEDPVLHSEVSLSLKLSADVSPLFHVLAYILLPNGEIVADSAKYSVIRCFNNKVSVRFSPDEVLPGSSTSLQVQAATGSLCALRVVDQSVVLMKPEKELTADKVHNLFLAGDVGGYHYLIEEHQSHSCASGEYPSVNGFSADLDFFRPWQMPSAQQDDVYSLFKGTRLKIITSSGIMKPLKCEPVMYEDLLFESEPHVAQAGVPGPAPDAVPNLIPQSVPEKEKQRVYFPETWIWELTPISASGRADLPVTVPDTITDWNGGAFCMGDSGFGMSSPASLRTFQPFFVELALPYSVVRGETFTLKASVFNYLKQCIMVQTTLLPSLELQEEPCATCQYRSCLCADESKTFYWNLTATNLGEVNITVRTEALDSQDLCHNEVPVVPKQGSVDTVIKPLLVQPGGVLEEKALSSLLCIQAGEDHSKPEEISLKVPENILKDSERAHITVLGDLMGSAMQNLDRLLAMPYGCGEQNMVLFAPNIFIMQYLEKTSQLNSEIQAKATRFLESGYQRQLTYKRDDYSYSAFGNSDQEGNTWLSAFVLKSFSKARPYIFIDETHLNQTYSWLHKNSQENGCFRSVGRLFNNAMKGGVDDEVSLSAYVTIALIESGVSLEDPVVQKAVSCLRKAALGVNNVYTQALLTYTFTLCGETDLRQALLDKLQEKAVRRDGQLHWERESSSQKSDVPYWYRAPSAEVELTSYMLLALLSGSTKDIGTSSEIVNWLSKQQNPYGGFSSTQDTVVALQALAKYAEVTFSDKGNVKVTVQSKSGFQEQFHVDKTNRLLLQRTNLPDIPGDYTVNAEGSGCVYVQAVLRYNVPPPRSDATFEVNVETDPKECPAIPPTQLQIRVSAKYTGSRERSNMALIEIKMLSGFIPVKSSVRELEKAKLVQRSEIQTDIVTLYLNELGHVFSEFNITVEQESLVKNLKAATVKVYDYYETGEFAIAEYNSPCHSDGEKNS